eukprot:434518_1
MSSFDSLLVTNFNNEERKSQYPDIKENPEFANKSDGQLKMVFAKRGTNCRSRMAELFNANHFMVLVFDGTVGKIKDANTIDILHLIYNRRGINRIFVQQLGTASEVMELKKDRSFKIYESHTIWSKSYVELIEFCQKKDDERSPYIPYGDNCHNFCIEFAKFCEISYSEINFTGMEGIVYGLIRLIKFCNYSIAYHGYRVYIYCIMFLLWSILATAWWSQIHSFQNEFKSQFDSCATGTYFILFSSFITIIHVLCDPYYYEPGNERFITKFCAVLFIVGGICYWFGGLAVTGVIYQTLHPICQNLSLAHKGYCSAFAGVWFTECSLIGVTSIAFGIDMVYKIFNYAIFRKFFNLGLLWFTSLVGFFCYAILSTKLRDIHDSGQTSIGAVAAGYFFIFVISSFYICWNGYKYYQVNIDKDYKWGERIIGDALCMLCTIFFGLIIICGYWAMTSYQSTSIEKAVLYGTGLNATYLAVYWVGIAFFWVFFLFIILSDMQLGTPESIDILREWDEVEDDEN